ncbi:Histone-fold [Phytophthora cactorum]|nr:Histone-fold [Phytophthora cactorum]
MPGKARQPPVNQPVTILKSSQDAEKPGSRNYSSVEHLSPVVVVGRSSLDPEEWQEVDRTFNAESSSFRQHRAQNLQRIVPERCEVSEHKEIVPLAYYNSACNVTGTSIDITLLEYLKSVLNVLLVRVTCYDRTWEGRGAGGAKRHRYTFKNNIEVLQGLPFANLLIGRGFRMSALVYNETRAVLNVFVAILFRTLLSIRNTQTEHRHEGGRTAYML